MSDHSINMSAESPNSSRPQSPIFGATPISPNTVYNQLANPEVDIDALTLRGIAGGLVATIRKRELDQGAERNRLQRRIDELGDRLAALEDNFSKAPEGYVENITQAPGFYIPTKNGLSRPAKWVKQLEDGRVAGFSPEDGPADSPFITDLYANPAYEYDEPQVPFPCWIREMLRGPSPVFNTLRDAIAAKGDWALLAEVIRYREYEDNVQMLSARVESINKDLDAVLVSQRLCEGRMEAARLDKQVSELQGFVHRFPEELGHREGRRYWKQLGRRGRGRPS
jgi:hypothetical protein